MDCLTGRFWNNYLLKGSSTQHLEGGFERDFTEQFYTIISTDLAILF